MKKAKIQDEKGQILIMAVFAAVMLMACFFLVFNAGMLTLEKIRLQNAVDAGAQTAALWQARGLNMEGHLNNAQEILCASYLAALVAMQPEVAVKIKNTSVEITRFQDEIDRTFPNVAQVSALLIARKNKADIIWQSKDSICRLGIKKKNRIPLIKDAFTVYELDMPQYWSPQERKGPYVSFIGIKKTKFAKYGFISADSAAKPKFNDETVAPQGKVRAGWRAVLMPVRR